MKCFLYFSSLLLLLAACGEKEKVQMYLVPKGYEGPLVMIEDAQAKDTLQVKGDTLIFDFRKSIILRFKGKFVEGTSSLSKLKYYYVDSLGNKTEIPVALGSYTKVDSNKVYILMMHGRVGESQVGEGYACDLISSPKNFSANWEKQDALCDSLFARRPSQGR